MELQRRGGRHSIFSLAGWLFADLLLAMTMIFLVASGVGTPSPIRPTPTPQVLALDTSPITFSTFEDPATLGDPNVVADVQNQVSAHLQSAGYSTRKVGFVLTFGGGINGVANAQTFNGILGKMANFSHAIFRNFHDLSNQDSEFDLEIYFFV